MDNGSNFQTKIGEDGKATAERHNTDHGWPDKHSVPHDHKVDWSNGFPDPGPPINYPDGNIPEFKHYRKEGNSMCDYENWPSKIVLPKDYDMDFESISDFKWCMHCNGEVMFVWKERTYGISLIDGKTGIYEAYKPGSEKLCSNVEEILEYVIDGVKLRDIITKVKVIERTI